MKFIFGQFSPDIRVNKVIPANGLMKGFLERFMQYVVDIMWISFFECDVA